MGSPAQASAPGDRQPGRARPAWLLPLIAAAATGAAAAWLLAHWGVEETDNAQLQAEITQIASRLPGTIARVPVQRDQVVAAGTPLVLLDDRPARARLAQAQADLAAAQGEARAASAQTVAAASDAMAAAGRARADQVVAAGELARARADDARATQLLRQGGIARQEAERIHATFLKAEGEATRSLASAQTARASQGMLGVERQRVQVAQAKVSQAQAALAQARLDLADTRITAPAPGRIGDRSAEPGRQVQPGQPLMTLVGSTAWVEANFKETQLDALYPGQAADVRVDAFPQVLLHGRVLSLAPASGARFALLPPDNASGNFTKVVQRVMARIGLERVPAALQARLVPGLSVTVRVRRR